MPNWDNFLGSLHGHVARSRFGLWCTVKANNQCRAIIGRALGGAVPQHELNGEEMLAAKLEGKLGYVVDVGANQGSWSDMFRKYQPNLIRGMLFEPSASALAKLHHHFDGDSCFEIVEAAAGEAQGEVFFNEEADAGETSSVVVRHAREGSVRRCVAMTTLDAEFARRDWPCVDFLKIDAEGYDFQVLRGARSLLAAQKIRLGQFEYGDGWRHAGSTLACAVDFLSEHGYACLLLTSDGLVAPKVELYGEYFGYSNYVFFRSDARSLIDDLIRDGNRPRTGPK
jgi:FkbM family methyltransferase